METITGSKKLTHCSLMASYTAAQPSKIVSKYQNQQSFNKTNMTTKQNSSPYAKVKEGKRVCVSYTKAILHSFSFWINGNDEKKRLRTSRQRNRG